MSIEEMNYFFDNPDLMKAQNKLSKRELNYCKHYSDIVQIMLTARESGQYYEPEDYKHLLRKQFNPNEMQDTQEFLRFVLGQMQDELNPQTIRNSN